MANTFLKALGLSVGCSRVEEELIPTAARILQTYPTQITLPLDRIDGLDGHIRTVDAALPQTDYVDIGPQTVAHINALLAKARTVVWNGPLGLFEVKPYDSGTNAVAKHMAMLTHAGQLVSVAGGGDTVAALVNAGVEDQLTFVSTAGGAFLEWLEGKELPGITALG
jgi:phosphoglycerate kinase